MTGVKRCQFVTFSTFLWQPTSTGEILARIVLFTYTDTCNTLRGYMYRNNNNNNNK